jgi:hypothetical protein
MAALAAMLATGGLLAWKGDKVADKLLDLRFGAVLPPAAYPAPTDAAEANRQDLEYLDRLTEVDRSFSLQAADAFHARVAALKARVSTLSPAQLLVGAAQAVALADNAHTAVDAKSWRERLNSAPVRMQWFEDGLFVVRAREAYVAALGARVISIDGHDPESLAREALSCFGGTPEHGRVSSPLVLESPEALHALHEDAPADRLVLDLVDEAGRTQRLEVPAVAPDQAPGASAAGRLVSPVPLEVEQGTDWRSARDPAQIPASLREPRRSLHAERLADGVLYLHLWQIRDDATGPVDAAIRAAAGPVSAAPWRRIVLDLRFDGGGEYQTVYEALRWLPQRLAPDGRLMILQDATTFSAAIISVVLARHFAGPRALIVGSMPGDRLAFWAEGNDLRLPNSRIRVTTSTGYHDWARGCRELRCYWPNFLYDVAGGSVAPDISVQWRFADYRRGIDTVLARALQP